MTLWQNASMLMKVSGVMLIPLRILLPLGKLERTVTYAQLDTAGESVWKRLQNANRAAKPLAKGLSFETMSGFHVFMYVFAQFQGLSAWLPFRVSPLAPQRKGK